MDQELMSLEKLGGHGALPAAAVLHLGAAIAARKPHGAIGIEQVLFDDAGDVVLHDDVAAASRWQPPEIRRRIFDDDNNRGDTIVPLSVSPATGPVGPRILWSLGRLLLELALGHVVEDDVVDDLELEDLLTMVDVQGQPLPPRLAEVLAAMLAEDPTNRLQSAMAAQRVCESVEQDFGDGDALLRRLLQAGRPRPLAPTADLPARAILSPDELRALDARAIAILEQRPRYLTPQPRTRASLQGSNPGIVDDDLAPVSATVIDEESQAVLKEAASEALVHASRRRTDPTKAVLADAPADVGATTEGDDDIEDFVRQERQRRLMWAAGAGGACVVLFLLWAILR